MKYFRELFILASLLSLTISTTGDKTCKSPNGEPVDWYAVFLFPQNSSPEGVLSYGYFGSTSTEMTFHSYKIDEFPPNRVTTFAQSKDKDFNFFFWNDDKTCKDDTKSQPASNSKAHAKGELIFDKKSGVFLLHSLPRFPTRMLDGTILTELPGNAGIYGQTFLCISTDESTPYKLAELLNYINISNNLSVKEDRLNNPANPWVEKLIINKYSSSYPLLLETEIQSKGKQTFTFFSKSHRKKDVPYDLTLRQKYGDNFFVRTWSRPSLSPSICEDNKLLNILDVQYDKWAFGKDKEHSKWAVAETKNICCFGDVNHTDSQKNRGGNIVCFENKKLHDIMIKAIAVKDSCPNKFLSFF